MKKAIINSTIFTGEEVVKDKIILTENGKIISLETSVPQGFETIDLKGKNIAPGLIDIQINGGEQYYFSQFPDEKSLLDIADACLKNGTTYFLVTLISSPRETILKAIKAVKNFQQKFPDKGCLGMHLEGPFFNPEKRGAHNPNIIRKPENKELQEIIDSGKNVIKIITIAPELFTDAQLEMLLQSGFIVSAGHSNATYKQAQDFFAKGIRMVTHLYNGMSGFGHRAPGLTGAALENDEVYTPVILDGFHVHYAAARIAYKIKKEKLFLITDSAFLGRKITSFAWEGLNAKMIDGRYLNDEGNLAGAAISMPEAIENAKRYLNISLQEAVEMAASRVARALRMNDTIGFIKPNYPAKFFVFDENDIINGNLVSIT